jgi:hypothetical protein
MAARFYPGSMPAPTCRKSNRAEFQFCRRVGTRIPPEPEGRGRETLGVGMRQGAQHFHDSALAPCLNGMPRTSCWRDAQIITSRKGRPPRQLAEARGLLRHKDADGWLIASTYFCRKEPCSEPAEPHVKGRDAKACERCSNCLNCES